MMIYDMIHYVIYTTRMIYDMIHDLIYDICYDDMIYDTICFDDKI
jgi:hypothetical protein